METTPPTNAQIHLLRTLMDGFNMPIPSHIYMEGEFWKKFIDLFAFDPESEQFTGYRRVNVIKDYLYWDKDIKHLSLKLDLSESDVNFMIYVISTYQGPILRESLFSVYPELNNDLF